MLPRAAAAAAPLLAAARIVGSARGAATGAAGARPRVVVKPPRAPRGRAGGRAAGADDPALPVVALIGRPNVGKSALFNALTRGRRPALVRDTPAGHVTRDWTRARGVLAGRAFAAVDTSGLEPAAAGGSLAAAAADATAAVVAGADVALLLLDARAGVVPADGALAAWLRSRVPPPLPPVLPVLTKADGVSAADLAAVTGDAAGLGWGGGVPASATTGSGLADLSAALGPWLDAAAERRERAAAEQHLADDGDDGSDLGPLRIALVGLPNVGKSSLTNALLGGPTPRVLASPVPGTTRDAVFVEGSGVTWRGRAVEVVDTAGWDAAVARRGGRAGGAGRGDADPPPSDATDAPLLAVALAQTRRWLNLAHVVVLVTDAAAAAARAAAGVGATGGGAAADAAAAALTKAEVQLLGAAADAGRAVVLVANKADLLPPGGGDCAAAALAAAAAARVPRLAGARAVALSATAGTGVSSLLPAVGATHTAWASRLPTGALNKWVAEGGGATAAPSRRQAASRGRSVDAQLARISFLTQPSARPPSFVAFVKGDAGAVGDAARRALANRLRRAFGFGGVPVRVAVRGKKR